jgi:hypothetical protein
LAVSFRRLALETMASDWPLMQINHRRDAARAVESGSHY